MISLTSIGFKIRRVVRLVCKDGQSFSLSCICSLIAEDLCSTLLSFLCLRRLFRNKVLLSRLETTLSWCDAGNGNMWSLSRGPTRSRVRFWCRTVILCLLKPSTDLFVSQLGHRGRKKKQNQTKKTHKFSWKHAWVPAGRDTLTLMFFLCSVQVWLRLCWLMLYKWMVTVAVI